MEISKCKASTSCQQEYKYQKFFRDLVFTTGTIQSDLVIKDGTTVLQPSAQITNKFGLDELRSTIQESQLVLNQGFNKHWFNFDIQHPFTSLAQKNGVMYQVNYSFGTIGYEYYSLNK